MKPRLKSSPAARSLIKRFEPFRDLAERGSDGRWVVGYGHHAAAKKDVRISEDEASLLLIYDVMQAEKAIDDVAKFPLKRNQRDALISFVHGIGEKAFRQSHVARYLYEGRAMAAAEAIALHGDTDFERRDAESSLFLSEAVVAKQGEALASSQDSTVELVIKVEHPGDYVEETSPQKEFSKPEPVLETQIAEAPVSGETEAVKDIPPPPMPLVSAGVLEAEDEISRILEAAQTEANAPVETQVSTKTKTKPRVIKTGPLDNLLAGRAKSVPEPVMRAETAIGQVPAALEEASADEPAASEEENRPLDTDTETNSEQAEKGVSETVQSSGPEQDGNPTDQVIARMAQHISDAPTQAEAPHSDTTLKTQEDRVLPEGMAVGYVMAGGLQARFETEQEAQSSDENVQIAPELAAIAAAMQDDEPLEEADDTAPQKEEIIAETDQAVEEENQPNETDAIETPRTISVSAREEKLEPPHPAEMPAHSNGSVGEVVGYIDDVEDDYSIRSHDVTAEIVDPLEEDFSPSDLAGGADPFTDSIQKKPKSDEGGWGFLAVLIAGLAVAGVGTLDVTDHWQEIWQDRQLTMGVAGVLAGSFLVIAAAWQLISVMLSKGRA